MATTFRSKKNWPLGVGSLNADINASTLTIVLDAGQGAGFPSSNFTVTIDEEIILIDSRSTDTLTVNASGRGYDSSTAGAHAAGTAVSNFQIVKDFTDLEAAVNAIESKIDGTNPLVLDDVFLKFGTDGDIKFGYDEATNDRGEWRDASDNVLAFLKDNGTSGIFGINTVRLTSGATGSLWSDATAIGIGAAGAVVAIGGATGAAVLSLDGATGTNRFLRFLTASANQWAIGPTTSDLLQISRYSGGAFADAPFQITSSGNMTLGAVSTQTITATARLLFRSVTDAGPMTATAGTQREIVWNTSDSKFYGCITTGSPAVWAAFH